MKPKKHYKTEGDVAILKCNVIAEPPASDITWTIEEEGCKRKIATDNDKYYGGLLESPSLVIDETEKMHDEGKYICEAENLAGPGSNSVHLTINSKSANTETIPDALILNEDNPYTLEERATDCHSMMVNKLSGVIYPASDCWENFKQLLKGRLPPVVLQKDNLHLYVQKLLDANRIQIGQYKPLYKAVKGVNKCASGIIKEAESEIKTIRRQGRYPFFTGK
ncbi:uncharacterized protein LOC110457928 [Mizuhopecten yessoensis]|uniref:uncharacterized protein LOC110457928 n=1 Tax=Mizuhopecten yessoensis TaxID=6573 RepID=UPI000B45E897|nr:uncharacterized protein LOC110457928 [Mizuhopecten yessoensis]